MATAETMTASPVARLQLNGAETAAEKTQFKESVAFDPSKHLSHAPPSKVYTMNELDYPNSRGVSAVGVSEPFPLFSAEAIKQMRTEVLSEEAAKYKHSSDLAQCQLRGFAQECAPFVYDAWKNPETLAIISKIAGVDLVPAMDYEIGHVNLAVNSEEDKARALASVKEKEASGIPWENESPIVDWHTDSYPFVCVTMLSDCTDMVGGETALRKGNGEVVKVRGPQMGSAVILQGRYIEHQALRALGTTERISMVTSFRPRSSATKDDTVLLTVRPTSNLGELYHQFAEYRFDMLQDRCRDINRIMRDQKRARRAFDTRGVKKFIREQIEFLEHMDREIVEDELVQKGVVGNSNLVSEHAKQEFTRRHAAGGVE